MSENPVLSIAPTAEMQAVGLTFVDVLAVAQHVVNLLESQGKTCVEIAAGCLRLIKAVSGRQMLEVFAALRDLQDDVSVLIAAIKAEFGI